MGACLSKFCQAWEEVTEDQWILDVLRNGYAPEFQGSRPHLTRSWQSHESANPENESILQDQVDTMLLKEAIEEVEQPSSLGHYSHMFLVPKKNGKLRPVINLKPLNRQLVCPSFKMETVADVTSAVRRGDWATSLDLTDGYFHIPIAPWFRKYLRFVINGKVFQFRALPFGLSTAPMIFTRMLSPLSVYLHSRGIQIHRYIDDLLIRSQSRGQCLKWTQELLDLLYRLGLGVNLENSDLDPSQDFVYIGVRFLTALGVMVPPQDRVEKIRAAAQSTLYTDASLTNWGAHAESFQASGAWTESERQLSINCLELLAVTRALQTDTSRWRDKAVMVATDNTTAVAYINHQGGTRSMFLMDLTYDLYDLTLSLGVTLRARHIPGRLNRTADLLSRSSQIVNTEWTLCSKVASQLWKVWGRPHLDLMATSLTTQLPTFVSPYPDPQAYAVDAMSCSWEGMDAYVFPPWAMIGEVLNRALHQSCVLTLVVPRWPNRAWFPLLLQLLIDNPVRLPQTSDLIRMPHNGLLYGQIHSSDLHACRLSANERRIRAFQAECPVESQQDSIERPLRTSMSRNGLSSCFGVTGGVLILSKPL